MDIFEKIGRRDDLTAQCLDMATYVDTLIAALETTRRTGDLAPLRTVAAAASHVATLAIGAGIEHGGADF